MDDQQRRPFAVAIVLGYMTSPTVPKAIRNAGWRVKGLINILLNKAVEALRGELEGGAENQEGRALSRAGFRT